MAYLSPRDALDILFHTGFEKVISPRPRQPVIRINKAHKAKGSLRIRGRGRRSPPWTTGGWATRASSPPAPLVDGSPRAAAAAAARTTPEQEHGGPPKLGGAGVRGQHHGGGLGGVLVPMTSASLQQALPKGKGEFN